MRITVRGFVGLVQLGLRNYWFLMSWVTFCFFVFRCDFNLYRNAPQYFYLRQILGVGICISRGTAAVVNVALVFVAMPMGRSFLSLIRGFIPLKITLLASSLLPPGKTIHLIVAWTILIASACHSISHIVNVLNFSRHYLVDVPAEINMASFKGQNPLVLIFCSIPGITGVAMLVILLLMSVTSLKCIRRENYEIFYYTHHCYVIFIVLLLLHPLSGVLKAVENIDSHPPGCIHNWNITSNESDSRLQYQKIQRNSKARELTFVSKKRDLHYSSNTEVKKPLQNSDIDSLSNRNVKPETTSKVKYNETTPSWETTFDEEISTNSYEEDTGQESVLNLPASAVNTRVSFRKKNITKNLPSLKPFAKLPKKINEQPIYYNEDLLKDPKVISFTKEKLSGENGQKGFSKLDSKINGKVNSLKFNNFMSTSGESRQSTLENISTSLSVKKLLEKLDLSKTYFLTFKVESTNSSDDPKILLDESDSNDTGKINDANKSSINFNYSGSSIFSSVGDANALPVRIDFIQIPNSKTKQSFISKNASLKFQHKGSNISAAAIIHGNTLDKPIYKSIGRIFHTICEEPPVFVAIQSKSWKWVLILSLYLLIDFAVKRVRGTEDVEILLVKDLPAHTFELTLQKTGFKCNPGQYVLLRCSTVSRYEWHPFTVAQCPTDESSSLVLLLRTKGNWCRKLQSAFSKRKLNYVCETPFIFEIPPLESKYKKNSPCQISDGAFNPASDNKNICESQLNDSFNDDVSSKFRDNKLNTKFCCHSCWSRFCRYQSNCSINHYPNCFNVESPKCVKTSQGLDECVEIKDNAQTSSLEEADSGVNDVKKCGNKIDVPLKDLVTSTSTDTEVIIDNENSKSYQNSNSCAKYFCYRDSCLNCMTVTETVPKNQRAIKLHFDGPYNSPNEYMVSYPVVIAIAGGIGITPLLASLNYLMQTSQSMPHHLHIVWVFRELEMPFPFLPFFQAALDKCWARNQEDRLELRFYCTQASSDLESQLNLAPKFYKDLAPFLRARLKFGRPNWLELFKVWKEFYERDDVGVFCCGPKSLNKQISFYCLGAVAEGLKFSYHHESFS